MISLFKLLFLKDNIVVVKRLPAAKALRAHQLGLTMGLVLLSLNMLPGLLDFWSTTNIGLLLWFTIGSYLGGIFLTFTIFLLVIIFILALFFPLSGFLIALQLNSVLYLFGYGFGAIFAILYNDLVYLFIHIFEKKSIKIAFVADAEKLVNIIKSPRENEEEALLAYLTPLIFYVEEIRKGAAGDTIVRKSTESIIGFIRQTHDDENISSFDQKKLVEQLPGNAGDSIDIRLSNLTTQLLAINENALDLVAHQIEPIVEKYLKLKERKLYNYRIAEPPPQPYTIAFVANPFIRKRRENRDDDFEFELDPIIEDHGLFLQTVHNALLSFELDPVLGRPEIFSRIRVVSIFRQFVDEEVSTLPDKRKDELSLLEEFQEEIFSVSGTQKRIDSNIIDPRKEMVQALGVILNADPDSPISVDEIDIIYGVTASATHDRAFAHFSDWDEVEYNEDVKDNVPDRQGVDYTLKRDPSELKNKPGEETIKNPPESDKEPFFNYTHDYYPTIPGRIAVSAVGARRYTYIHEFAHAMSSAFHGAIVDEYTDGFIVDGLPDIDIPWFYINRIERIRRNMPGCQIIPVHKDFVDYNNNHYYSDLDHPSAEEDWQGYFPERVQPNITCTMDRSYGHYQFDPLLSSFIYDRLVAKLCRRERLEITPKNIWDGVDKTTNLIANLDLWFIYFQTSEAPLSSELKEGIKAILQDKAQAIARTRFGSDEIQATVTEVEGGSLKIKMSLTTLVLVFNLFGSYPQFKTGVNAVVKDLKKAAVALQTEFAKLGIEPPPAGKDRAVVMK